jgi:hypothetical protein
MRRRDVVFMGVAWGVLLGGLAWALSTQFRWVREAKPIKRKQPDLLGEEAQPPVEEVPRVIGTIDDDTRAAMAKGLASKKPKKPERKP